MSQENVESHFAAKDGRPPGTTMALRGCFTATSSPRSQLSFHEPGPFLGTGEPECARHQRLGIEFDDQRYADVDTSRTATVGSCSRSVVRSKARAAA